MFHQLLIVLASTTLVLGVPGVGRNPKLWYPDVGITGGLSADIQDHPYQISLWKDTFFICGGSILDETHILTTAYCTYGFSAEQLHILAGTSFLNESGTVVNVKAIHPHPSFNPSTMDYDICVLSLESLLNFSKTIAPISLGESELPAGTTVEVAGWGFTLNSFITNQLQVVHVPIVSRNKCRSSYAKINAKITDRMICAGFDKGGKGPCTGDSGGLLVHGNKQYGIFSWSYGCAEAGYPAICSDTVVLRDFIDCTIKKH